MDKQLIAFCGKQGSGKDFNCDRLVKEQNFTKVSFADNLREVGYAVIGMEPLDVAGYTKIKSEKVCGELTFRNILENLGESIRKLDNDFWARTCISSLKKIKTSICVSDLRHANEYFALKRYCEQNNIEFKVVFCNYKSDRYVDFNPHESAQLAQFLETSEYIHGQTVDEFDILIYKTTIEDIRHNLNPSLTKGLKDLVNKK